jgi:tetratricopeptide (TPR) repeat protein
MQTFDKAARDFPAEPFLWQELAYSHRWIGDLVEEGRGLEEAEREYRIAISLYAALKTEVPSSAFYYQEEAYTYWTLAGKLERAGRPEPAVTEYRKAIALHEEWLAKFPAAESDPRGRLASVRLNLVSLLRTQGKDAEAETLEQKVADGGDALVLNNLAWRLATDPLANASPTITSPPR